MSNYRCQDEPQERPKEGYQEPSIRKGYIPSLVYKTAAISTVCLTCLNQLSLVRRLYADSHDDEYYLRAGLVPS